MSKAQFIHSDTLLIIFAREPVAGQVKTRLIPALGETGSTELYKRLLNYTIEKFIFTKHSTEPLRNTKSLIPVNLCLTPESQINYFQNMDCAESFIISRQVGDDLGARMFNALSAALCNFKKAILIGTDCPFLSVEDIEQAIKALDSNDMVFSPAKDGGYVLVGAKKATNVAFKSIQWSTDKVMSQTRESLTQHQLSWFELRSQIDIDVKDDLKYLLQHNEFKDYLSLLGYIDR